MGPWEWRDRPKHETSIPGRAKGHEMRVLWMDSWAAGTTQGHRVGRRAHGNSGDACSPDHRLMLMQVRWWPGGAVQPAGWVVLVPAAHAHVHFVPGQTWASFRWRKNFNSMNSTTFVLFDKYCPIVDQLGSKDSSRDFQLNCVISYFFYLHLILHTSG